MAFVSIWGGRNATDMVRVAVVGGEGLRDVSLWILLGELAQYGRDQRGRWDLVVGRLRPRPGKSQVESRLTARFTTEELEQGIIGDWEVPEDRLVDDNPGGTPSGTDRS